MRILCACLIFLVGFVGHENEAFAACQNKVGGVCVDKKPAKSSKKRTRKKTRKKTVKKVEPPKEVVEPEIIVPVEVTAQSCSRMSPTYMGKNAVSRTVRYMFHNGCDKKIYVYITPSPCFRGDGPANFAKRQRLKIRPNKKKSVTLAHSGKIFKKGKSALEVRFSFEKTRYPEWDQDCG